MIVKKLAITAMLSSAVAAIPAQAIPPAQMGEFDFTCPIGGEEFLAERIENYIIFESRPDGKPYDTFTISIPECPSNGFLIFQGEFTNEELKILTALVLSDEYQAMRKSETPHRRIYWLRSKISGNRLNLATDLMAATWETDYDPERKSRYQNDFINAVQAIPQPENNPERVEEEEWFWLKLHTANALRELGHFDKAKALIAQLRDIPYPTHSPRSENPELHKWVADYLNGLDVLTDEKNPTSKPANMMPILQATFRCATESQDLSPVEEQTCRSDEIQQKIANATFTTDGGEELTGKDAVRALALLIDEEERLFDGFVSRFPQPIP